MAKKELNQSFSPSQVMMFMEKINHNVKIIAEGQVGTNQRLVRVENKLEAVFEKVGELSVEITGVKQRLDSIEQRLDSIEQRLDSIETRMTRLETRMNSLETEVKEARKEISDIKIIVTKKTDKERADKLEKRILILEKKLI